MFIKSILNKPYKHIIRGGEKLKTDTYIKNLRENFIRITTEQEKAIKKYWGKKIGNEYTEQDIWEQTRKVINNA